MSKTNKTRENLSAMFIAALQEERLPWHQPWHMDIPSYGEHVNITTGKPYRGINALYLWIVGLKKGYKDYRWCTFKQASEQGWKVKKGSKSVPVEYWYVYDKRDKKPITFSQMNEIVQKNVNRKVDMLPQCRSYSVFNGIQVEGIPALEQPERIQLSDAEMQQFLLTYTQNMNLPIVESDHAAYVPLRDELLLPPSETFETEVDFFLTAMHECAHSTGHESRLSRPLNTDRSSEEYAIEELRAEIASTFIVSDCGMQIPSAISENNKAYVQNWAAKICKDETALFAAIKDAEKIADFVCEHGERATTRRRQAVKEAIPLAITQQRQGHSKTAHKKARGR